MGGRSMSRLREGELKSYSKVLNMVLTIVDRVHLRHLPLPHLSLQRPQRRAVFLGSRWQC